MIITRTPFRISFFGGGTDYPQWFKDNGGAVVSATIDKFCWITCRRLPPFFEHKSRIIYSVIENVRNVNEMKHPSARECLKFLEVKDGLEIHHDGDLPARTGLGSSSSFTVGLLHALYGLQGKMVSKVQLSRDAIYVEQNMIKENVGCQDQIAAAFGGLNRIEFTSCGDFRVDPVVMKAERLSALECRLMLFYTGLSRIASEVAAEQINNISTKKAELSSIRNMVDQSLDILTSNQNLKSFGELLHEGWLIKKSLSSRITTSEIDSMYAAARKAGAVGGKLLGAGGGGFVLLYVEPDDQPQVRQALARYLHVPFCFESRGSQVVFYQP